MMMAANSLAQILNIRKLAGLRRALKIGRELAKLAGLRRIAIGLRRIGRGLEVGGDLRGNLLILRRILLLQLLQIAQQLGQRRQLRRIALGGCGRCGANAAAGSTQRYAGRDGAIEERLNIGFGGIGGGVYIHGRFESNRFAVLTD